MLWQLHVLGNALKSVNIEYPEVNIAHHGKRININKRILAEDMLVPWSLPFFAIYKLFFGFGYLNTLASIRYGMFIALHIDEAQTILEVKELPDGISLHVITVLNR